MNALTDARYLTTLEDRFTVEAGRIFLNGPQAFLRLMLDQRRADERQGLKTAGFVTGYPGSPLHGVDDVMLNNKALLDSHHLVFQPGLNEELAATAVYGTQTLQVIPGAKYEGVFSFWYGKSLGLERASDAIHHGNFKGIGRNGGVLMASGDDPHARSTAYPTDTNLTFTSFYMPVLAPGNVQEILDFGLHGYALSRASGMWIGFKTVNDVVEATGVAEVSPDRVRPVLPQVLYQGQPIEPKLNMNTLAGAMIEEERRMHDGRLEVVRQYARLNGLNRIVANPRGARVGLMAGGKTYYDLRQALVNLGIDEAALEQLGIRILKMGLLYPVEPTIVREFAEGLEEIFVIEDKRPMLELYLKDILYALPHRPVVVGKRDENDQELLTAAGELSADQIADALCKRFALWGLAIPLPPPSPAVPPKPIVPLAALPGRTPFFCSGCPHNRGLRVPEGSVVGAGTGCHGMNLWVDTFGAAKGFTQMGGEGTQWIGVAPFTTTSHFIQNMGDGTYHHSGSLAIRAAIAARIHMTFKILYNSAVAMTGGQDVTGALSVPKLVQELQAEGARRIIITTDEPERYAGAKAGVAEVWHRDRIVEAEKLLAATDGVTVLIHDQQCAAEKRRLRKRGKMADRPKAAFINTRVCEGCGDCGVKSNCLSVQPIQTDFGRKTQIHQSSCNQDFSCMDGDCPSFLTVQTLDGKRPRPGRKAALEFPADMVLPEPAGIVDSRYYNMALMGIGGTGVVTVNQILGTAAFIDGHQVQTYDNTGSSQKAGPVVSHLKIFPRGESMAPMVSRGVADLYLAFDALSASNPVNLAMGSPQRTVAVVSTSAVPTGDMVSKVATRYPAQAELARRIDSVSRSDRNLYIDVQPIAEQLLGDHMATNLMMVGIAWQMGLIPISAHSIEAAIRLNGTAVKMNLDAFRWGRLHVVAPKRVEQILAGAAPKREAIVPLLGARLVGECVPGVAPGSELQRLLATRADELVAFQDEAVARRYLAFVRLVRERRPQADALAVAVARNLYKLLAYKDEYEVARLHLDTAAQAELASAFGEAVRIKWNLHPTFLRALGVKKKVQLGGWFRPALHLLRAMKVVRGTALDLLGRTQVRRIERALPAFYMTLIEAAMARNDGAEADLMAVAESPDMIRGYEHVKLGNVTKFMSDMRVLQQKLRIEVPTPPELAELTLAPALSAQPRAA